MVGFFCYTCIVKKNSLIVLVGPTGVGKTELSLQLAEFLNATIISSDSRQIFKELVIGTAAPAKEELQRVKHYFVGTKSVTEYCSAGSFENDVLVLLDTLFLENNVQLMVGGSMLYVDAVCKGFDNIPTIPSELREEVLALFQVSGLPGLQQKLFQLDPKHFQVIDINNKQRLMRAVEIVTATGKTHAELFVSDKVDRPFNIIKIGLNLPREQLYNRINTRVDIMLEQGLVSEVESLYSFKDLNSLNTVGYKEIFAYMDGSCDLETAVNLIKQNSRRYAKRQLTWFNADKDITWFDPSQLSEIIAFIKSKLLI